VEDVMAMLINRRHSAQVIETGATVEMKAADQIAVAGTLRTGPLLTAHFRGGMSRGTNFHLEINGTLGDLVLTSTLGYPGVGSTTILGGKGDDVTVAELDLPAAYADMADLGMGTNVFRNYALLASDLRTGTRTAPGLDQAVGLHRLLNAIERSASAGTRQTL
jgi:predicted dehydrogenase